MTELTPAPGRGPRDGRPNKHAQRREATRAGLLQLGLDRFQLKGYAATTIEDIVRDSDYTRGAFYFHFGSKEEFFLEVLRFRRRMRIEWWVAALDPQPTTLREAQRAKTRSFARQREWSADDGLIIAEFFQSLPEGSPYLTELRDIYAAWIREQDIWVDAVRGLGLTRTDLTTAELSQGIMAITEGFLYHRVVYGSVPDAEAYDDLVVRWLQP